MKRFLSTSVMALLITGLVLAASPAATQVTAASGSTTLDADGEQVRIVRDRYVAPYIYANTDRALSWSLPAAGCEEPLGGGIRSLSSTQVPWGDQSREGRVRGRP